VNNTRWLRPHGIGVRRASCEGSRSVRLIPGAVPGRWPAGACYGNMAGSVLVPDL